MDEFFRSLADKVLSQCGASSGLLLAGCVYLAWSLNRERAEREADRKIYQDDIAVRTASIAKLTEALQQLHVGMASMLEIKQVIIRLVEDSVAPRRRGDDD